METQAKPQAITSAQKKTVEILDAIHYGHTSLTHHLVKAHRAGMPGDNGRNAFILLRNAITEAEAAFEIAIAQPDQKPAVRPVVSL